MVARRGRCDGGRYVDARTTSALLSRFEGFAAEQNRLTSQLICLARHRDATTICQGSTRDAATILMNSKGNGMLYRHDAAGSKEVDRLVAAMRARSDHDTSADRARLHGRIAEIQRQLGAIAKQAGWAPLSGSCPRRPCRSWPRR